MKIKIPIKELEREDVYDKVEEALMKDPENAYTTMGIMVEVFGVKPQEVKNKPFSDWKKGLPTMYGRIDRCLKKLKKEGKVNQKKHGKAWVYWYRKPEYKVRVGDIK